MNDKKTHTDLREIRINPIVPTESVLVSTARGLRPRKDEKPLAISTESKVEKCPFCKGNEDKTPPTIASWPNEDAVGNTYCRKFIPCTK